MSGPDRSGPARGSTGLAEVRPRRLRRLRRWLLILLVLAAALAAAGKLWIGPYWLRRDLHRRLQGAWEGSVEIGRVEVNLFGPLRVARIAFRDRLGRTWLDAEGLAFRLRGWPGFHPRLTDIHIRRAAMAAWVEDGQIRPPIKPLDEATRRLLREHVDLQAVRLAEGTLAIVDDGGSLGIAGRFTDLGAALVRHGRRYRAWLTRRPRGRLCLTQGGKRRWIDLQPIAEPGAFALSCDLDPKTLRGRLELRLTQDVPDDQGAAILSALKIGGLRRAGGRVAADLASEGPLDTPRSLQPRGTIRLTGWKLVAADGTLARRLDVALGVDGYGGRIRQGSIVTDVGRASFSGTSFRYDAAKNLVAGDLKLRAEIQPLPEPASPAGGLARPEGTGGTPEKPPPSFWSKFAALEGVGGTVALAGPFTIRPDTDRPIQLDVRGDFALTGRPGKGLFQPIPAAETPAPAGSAGAPSPSRTARVAGKLAADVALAGRLDEPGELVLAGLVRVRDGRLRCGEGEVARDAAIGVELNGWTGRVRWGILVTEALAATFEGTTFRYDPKARALHADLTFAAEIPQRKKLGPFWSRFRWLEDLAGKVALAGPVTVRPGGPRPIELDLQGRFDVRGPARLDLAGVIPPSAGPGERPKPQRARARGYVAAKLTLAGRPDAPDRLAPAGSFGLAQCEVRSDEGVLGRDGSLVLEMAGWSPPSRRAGDVPHWQGRILHGAVSTDVGSARARQTAFRFDPAAGCLQADLALEIAIRQDRAAGGFWSKLLWFGVVRGQAALAGPLTYHPDARVPLQADLRGWLDLKTVQLPTTPALMLSNVRSPDVRLTHDRVRIAALTADVYGGRLHAELRAERLPRGPHLWNGVAEARNVRLDRLSRALAQKRPMSAGKASVRCGFSVRAGQLRTLQAEGVAFVDDADLWHAPVLSALFEHLGLPLRETDGEVAFTLRGAEATITAGRLANPVSAIVIEPGGKVNLEKREVDVFVVVAPLKHLRDLLAHLPLVRLLVMAQEKLVRVRLKGPWDRDPARLVADAPLKAITDGTLGILKKIAEGGGQLGRELFKPLDDLLKPPKDRE